MIIVSIIVVIRMTFTLRKNADDFDDEYKRRLKTVMTLTQMRSIRVKRYWHRILHNLTYFEQDRGAITQSCLVGQCIKHLMLKLGDMTNSFSQTQREEGVPSA